jgi:hypothetical protein
MSERRGFASDNHAGVHPEVMEAMAAANEGHAAAYGGDPWTARAQQRFREHFGPEAQAFPVFNGTGANVVALTALSPRWGGVVTADVAHANTDENGAPERVGGLKILPCPSVDGRITPDAEIYLRASTSDPYPDGNYITWQGSIASNVDMAFRVLFARTCYLVEEPEDVVQVSCTDGTSFPIQNSAGADGAGRGTACRPPI